MRKLGGVVIPMQINSPVSNKVSEFHEQVRVLVGNPWNDLHSLRPLPPFSVEVQEFLALVGKKLLQNPVVKEHLVFSVAGRTLIK